MCQKNARRIVFPPLVIITVLCSRSNARREVRLLNYLLDTRRFYYIVSNTSQIELKHRASGCVRARIMRVIYIFGDPQMHAFRFVKGTSNETLPRVFNLKHNKQITAI